MIPLLLSITVFLQIWIAEYLRHYDTGPSLTKMGSVMDVPTLGSCFKCARLGGGACGGTCASIVLSIFGYINTHSSTYTIFLLANYQQCIPLWSMYITSCNAPLHLYAGVCDGVAIATRESFLVVPTDFQTNIPIQQIERSAQTFKNNGKMSSMQT